MVLRTSDLWWPIQQWLVERSTGASDDPRAYFFAQEEGMAIMVMVEWASPPHVSMFTQEMDRYDGGYRTRFALIPLSPQHFPDLSPV